MFIRVIRVIRVLQSRPIKQLEFHSHHKVPVVDEMERETLRNPFLVSTNSPQRSPTEPQVQWTGQHEVLARHEELKVPIAG